MARVPALLIALASFSGGFAAAPLRAADQTPAPAASAASDEDAPNVGRSPRPNGDRPGRAIEKARQAMEGMPPEQRRRVLENLEHWSQLPPGERDALRDREQMRRRMIQEEINTALQAAGLQLSPEERLRFRKRYSEERRKIEEKLRDEMAEKRKPLVHNLIDRLKTEFANSPKAATSSPAPGSVAASSTSSKIGYGATPAPAASAFPR